VEAWRRCYRSCAGRDESFEGVYSSEPESKPESESESVSALWALNSGPSPEPVLHLVLRHLTPSVRPDDVLAGLHAVCGFAPTEPAQALRVAQGMLDEASATVGDPLKGMPTNTT